MGNQLFKQRVIHLSVPHHKHINISILFEGPGMGDLQPNTAWIRCGEKGCRSKGFSFHAICHGLKVSVMEAPMFCEEFIRCKAHVKQKTDLSALTRDFETSSEDTDSDEAFKPRRSKKVSSVAKSKKKTVSVVATPGSYNISESESSDSAVQRSQSRSRITHTNRSRMATSAALKFRTPLLK